MRSLLAARPRTFVVVAAIALAAMLALLLTAGGAPAPSYPGLPDPGLFTGWALPVVRVLGDLVAVAVVGSLLVPLLTMKRIDDEIVGSAARALGSVRALAIAWVLLVVARIVLTLSDQFAVPVWDLDYFTVWEFVTTIGEGQLLALQSVLAVMLALGSRWVVTVRAGSYLLVLGLVALVPPVLTGHSAESGSHDAAIVSLLLHVLAVSLWAGGVGALWWHLRRAKQLRDRAARRFSAVAAWCFGIVAVSGLINALVRVGGVVELFTTSYGLGAVAKAALLGLLGLVAVRARRAASAADRDLLATVVGIEVALLAALVGLGAALSRTPPPIGDIYTSPAQSVLGGPLPPPMTASRLFTELTPNGVGLAVVLLGGAAYAAGVLAVRRQGGRWPIGRTIAFAIGLAVVLYATCGGLGVYSRVQFSVHMMSHMAMSMVAPIFLVLGAPINLALRALPGSDVAGGTGPRQLLAGALKSRYVRFFANPVVAAINFAGSLYVIYLTGAFDWLMLNHLGHAFMELHFLLAGVLFYESLIGIAPIPGRLPHLARMALMLLVISFHAFFAISIMGASQVIGDTYYHLLGGTTEALLDDQRYAGSLTWGFSEAPLVVVLIALLIQWFRDDSRTAKRHDRQAERDGDAELTAYNEWLAQLGRETDKHDR